VPELRNLSLRLRDAPFLLISISNDSDRGVLEKFVAEHRMEWMQVWDEKMEVTRRLGVSRYPTYLLVDHEGEVVYGTSGWTPSMEREIQKRVGAAVSRARRSAPTPAQ
jgi:hypothetical protein